MGGAGGFSGGGRAYLGEAVGPGLEDDEQHPDGHGDLLQLQARGQAGSPQHPAHAVPRRHGDLPQAQGQAAQLGGGEGEALQHGRGQLAWGRGGGFNGCVPVGSFYVMMIVSEHCLYLNEQTSMFKIKKGYQSRC